MGETNPLPLKSLQRKPGRLDSIWSIFSGTRPVCFSHKTSPRAGAFSGISPPRATRLGDSGRPFFPKQEMVLAFEKGAATGHVPEERAGG